MTRPLRINVEGGWCHITARGDNRERIYAMLEYGDVTLSTPYRLPIAWPWTGFAEVVGQRIRYRIVDLAELQRRTNQPDLARLQKWYAAWIADATAEERSRRDERWTQSIAVGSKPFVERLGRHVEDRMKVDIGHSAAGGWILREQKEAYSPDLTAKKSRKPPKSG